MDKQQLAESVAGEMLHRDRFSQWLGIELLEIAPGSATVEMSVREEMLNGFGICHGGITFSLADSAFAFASNSHGRISVSIENSISYPKAVRAGDRLRATAIQRKLSTNLGIFDVEVKNGDGAMVGLFRGTVYRTDKDLLQTIGT